MRSQTKKLVCFIFLISLFSAVSEGKIVLTPEEYVKQVQKQNQSYQSQVMSMKSFELRMAEGRREFMPFAYGEASYKDDQRPPESSFFPSQIITQRYGLGVKAKLRTGTQVDLGYSVLGQRYYDYALLPSIEPVFYASPALTIVQPLWRDFNAQFSKANEQAIQAGYRAQIAQTKLSAQQTIMNAESVYWRLALFKQLIVFDQESIERAKKILQWNERRVNMNVADRSDLLQAQAALKSKELQIQADLEGLRAAKSEFNSLRNVPGEIVEEDLLPPEKHLEKILVKELKRLGERVDVQAAFASAEAQRAAARSTYEDFKPQVDLFGSALFNGKGNSFESSTGTSWTGDKPTYTIGLRLQVPLDRGLVNDAREGHSASAQAAEYLADRSRYQLDQDWNDLHRQYKEALARRELARELENLQEKKLKWERTRFTRGRTTSFQVLQFEENFSESQVSRLRIENELMTLRARARFYNGESL